MGYEDCNYLDIMLGQNEHLINLDIFANCPTSQRVEEAMKEIMTRNLIMTNKATLVHELLVTETLEDSDICDNHRSGVQWMVGVTEILL